MDPRLFAQCAEILTPVMRTPSERAGLIAACVPELLSQIDTTGATDDFLARAVNRLHEYGALPDGRLALVAILEAVREKVGVDIREQIDDLTHDIVQNSRPRPVMPVPGGDPMTQWLVAAFNDLGISLARLETQVRHIVTQIDEIKKDNEQTRETLNGNGTPGVKEDVRLLKTELRAWRRETRAWLLVLTMWCFLMTGLFFPIVFTLINGGAK